MMIRCSTRAQRVTCPKGRGPRRLTVAVEGNDRLAALGLAPLSAAERQVLVLYGQGLDRARIAKALFRSPKTVDKHRTVLLSKLRLGGGAGASRRIALFAVKHGYVTPGAICVEPAGDCEGFDDETGCPGHRKPGIDWVIVGGESGPGARGCNVEWIREIVLQCGLARVACFVKQLGAHPYDVVDHSPEPAASMARKHGIGPLVAEVRKWSLASAKGGDPMEWPPVLRVREFPHRPEAGATGSAGAVVAGGAV